MAEDKNPLPTVGLDITVAVFALIFALAFLGFYFDTIIGWYASFLDWIGSLGWQRLRIAGAIIFSILNAVLIGFILATLRKHNKLDKTLPDQTEVVVHMVPVEQEVAENWEDIRRLANSQNPSDWNMAIIRADGLLDDALLKLGYQGETMADKLKIVDPTKLPSLERVWSAHRLRNTIVHGPSEEHTRETMIHALRSFEQAFKELGIMKEEKI